MELLFRNLGTYLNAKRKAAGLSQGQVARSLGYSSPQFISNIERGLCSPPLKKLRTMIQLYQVPGEEVAGLILRHQRLDLEKRLKPRRRA